MDNILEPLLAMLVIILPLGLAYFIVFFRSRNPGFRRRNVSTITRDVPLQRKTLHDFEALISQKRRL
jgi:hypothetical protein